MPFRSTPRSLQSGSCRCPRRPEQGEHRWPSPVTAPPDIDPQDSTAETPNPPSVPGQQSAPRGDVKGQENTDRRQQRNSASPSKSVTLPPGNTPAPSSTPSTGPNYRQQLRPRGDDDEDEVRENHQQTAQEFPLEHSGDTSDDNQDRVSSNWILCRPEGDSTMVYRYKIRDDNTVEGAYVDDDGAEISIIESQRKGASEGHVNPAYQSESNIAEAAAAAPIVEKRGSQPTSEVSERRDSQASSEVSDRSERQPSSEVSDRRESQPTSEVSDRRESQPSSEVSDRRESHSTSEVSYGRVSQPTSEVSDRRESQPTSIISDRSDSRRTSELADRRASQPTKVTRFQDQEEPAKTIDSTAKNGEARGGSNTRGGSKANSKAFRENSKRRKSLDDPER